MENWYIKEVHENLGYVLFPPTFFILEWYYAVHKVLANGMGYSLTVIFTSYTFVGKQTLASADFLLITDLLMIINQMK